MRRSLVAVSTTSLVICVGGFHARPAPFHRTGVAAFGRARKGNLNNELAGLSKPKDPKAKKKKKGGSKSTGDGAGSESDFATQASTGDGVVDLPEFDATNPLSLPPDVKDGRQVLDPVSKKAYYLPLDEAARMEAAFPRADEATRAKYRLNWSTNTGYEEVVERMSAADVEGFSSMRDFVLANHDHLGYRASLLLTGLKMNAQYRKDAAAQEKYEVLRRSFVVADQSVTVALRQLTREAEVRLGPIAASGDAKAFKALTSLGASEICGLWVLIKAAVSTWSDKVMFANEKIAKMQTMSSRPDAVAIGQQEKDRDSALGSLTVWANLAEALMEDKGFTDKLRPELKFIDAAVKLETETELRKFATQTFCPENDISIEELREGVRSFRNTVQRLAPQNYGALADLINNLASVVCAGAPDEADVYSKAVKAKATDFETYELPGSSKLHELETVARSREDDKNYGPAASLQKSITVKRPELDWANEQNEKTIVEEFEDFNREQQDLSMLDPSNFEDVRTVAAKLDALRAEYKRNRKGASSALVADAAEEASAVVPKTMEDYVASTAAALEACEENADRGDDDLIQGPNLELNYAPLPEE